MRDTSLRHDAKGRIGGLCLVACLVASPARPQHRPGEPPATSGQRVADARDVGRYEMMYGSPEFHSLDAEFDSWPPRQAIRTVGRVSPIPGRGQRTAQPSSVAGPMAPRWDNQFARYQICGERVCVAVTPVWEVREAFEALANGSSGEALEVVGAVDGLPMEGQQPGTKGPIAFQVWQASETLKATTRREEGPGSSLEPLVRYPKGAEGRVVTVKGTFRGANLFEDLPLDSRRSTDDWVLRDGPFAIWVTGKDPKGKGFSLDVRSKADCHFRLEVQGEIRTENEYIYLRAKSIQLLGRAASE
jgi:hypothetical protein